MSKITVAADTTHTLTLTAMEEASRVGLRTADIDHLFLALVLTNQLAGQALRSYGITLDTARQAVSDQHTADLAALGIPSAELEPGSIVFHDTNGYDLSDRARNLMARAQQRGKPGDAAAILRELIDEPSDMITQILQRLSVPVTELNEVLDAADQHPQPPAQHSPHRNTNSRTVEAFIPAPPEEVWQMLTEPARIPEWDVTIGQVATNTTPTRVGTTWEAWARTEQPNGKHIPMRPELIAQQVELVASENPWLVHWRFTYPNAVRVNTRELTFQLEPTAGGTKLQLRLSWGRTTSNVRRHTLQRLLSRPCIRFALWMQTVQLANSIGRVFR